MVGVGDQPDQGACRLLQLPDTVFAVLMTFLGDVLDRGRLRATCRRGRRRAPPTGPILDLSGRRDVITLLTRCPVAPHIAQLRLQFCADALKDGAALPAALSRFTSLDYIDVGGCYDLRPDHLLQVLSRRRLLAASFYWCPHISDEFVGGVVAASRSLRALNLSGAKRLTNYAVCEIAANLHQLRHLDCTKMVNLTDKALIALAQSRSAPVLETLVLYACPNFTDLGLRILVKGCRALRHVDLCGSLHVTDGGVEHLSRGSLRLERLNLTWCTLLTDRAVVALAHHCPRLARLELRGIREISDRGLLALSRDGRNWIRELDVVGCVGVTDRTRTNLRRLFPRLPALTKC